MRKLKPYVLAAAAALGLLIPLQADSSLTSFYNAISAYNNVTGPTALQGQGMNIYSGGDIYMRNPIQSTQILSISPPGYRAGCGGIDLWGGSFSFINKQQFIAMMKNIGQNAAGYFFQLALQSLSQSISSLLGFDVSKLMTANGINIDTCQAGQAIANSVGQQIGLADAQNGMTVGTFLQNTYNDFTSAYTDNTNANTQAADTYEQANPTTAPPTVQGNLTWNAIQNTALPSLFSTDDLELMMSAVGTMVVAPNPNAGSSSAAGTVILGTDPPIIQIDQIVGTAAGLPPDAWYYQCDTTTGTGSCMNPSLQLLSSTGDQSIMQIVSQNVAGILAAMRSRTALTAQQQAFVQTMPAPIYKVLAVVASSGTGTGQQTGTGVLDNIVSGNNAQILAYQYAAYIMSSLTDQVEKTLTSYESSVSAPERKQIREMIQMLEDHRTHMYQKLQTQHADIDNLETMVVQAQAIERTLYGNLSAGVASNLQWSNSNGT